MSLLRRYVFHNFGLKLVSLAAAVVLWSLIATEPEMETSITVPVEFHNVPRELEMMVDQTPEVHVQVKGPATQVRSIRRNDVAVVLDLMHVERSGERTFTLDRSQVVLPQGISLVKSVPSQLRLNFERRLTRAVPVQPLFTGGSEPSYEVVHYTVNPPLVKVVGPESRVALLDYATTDPIDVSRLTGSGSFTANAYLADPHLRFENIQSVRVSVEMKKR
ncbi:MAG: YbbR-like domain-containing protein [Acidobacteria bacterium]|nr:YbbR-like domain-containing protein [Acidobacteriota bacterium]